MPIRPAEYDTIRSMLKAGVKIRATCNTCRTCLDVDLAVLAVIYSIDACLIGKHPSCKVSNCEGTCTLLAQRNEGVPYVTLDRYL